MKKIILFGAGNIGKNALDYYGDEQVEFFVDNNKSKVGTYFHGKIIISYNEMRKITERYRIIISVDKSLGFSAQIEEQLMSDGIFDYEFYSSATKDTNLNIQNIGNRTYEKLGDDVSREIFTYRAMKFITGDPSFITKMTLSTFPAFKDKIKSYETNKLVLCNPSSNEKSFAYFHPNIISAFMDSDTKETHESSFGFFTHPFNVAPTLLNEIFVLPVLGDKKVVLDELNKYNIPMERIIDLSSWFMHERMYFDLPCLVLSENEVFIDAGCFDGNTTKYFFNTTGNKGRVIAFEPERKQFEICKCELSKTNNVTIVNSGLWHKKDVLSFSPQFHGGSKIHDKGIESISVVALDEFLENTESEQKTRVTFIKMDVEGAEANAMLGARNTIRCQKPKLAISIYHNPEDIFKIPDVILKINPSYTFYLRHYTLNNSETVLYAI